ADLYSRQRLWPSATADFSKAIELYPNYFGYWTRRAHSYCEQKLWEQAAADFEKAISLNFANPTNAMYRAFDLESIALLRLVSGEILDCRKECARLLKEFANPPPNIAYAIVWTCSVAPDAVPHLEQVVRLAGNAQKAPALPDPIAHDVVKRNLGIILYRT